MGGWSATRCVDRESGELTITKSIPCWRVAWARSRFDVTNGSRSEFQARRALTRSSSPAESAKARDAVCTPEALGSIGFGCAA